MADMRIFIGVLVAVLVSACGSSAPSPTATPVNTASPPPGTRPTLVVRQTDLVGGNLYIEGAIAFVEVRDPGGAIVATAQGDYGQSRELLRMRLPTAAYTVSSYVRPCDAACPNVDPPTDRCELPITLAGPQIEITIRRTVGAPCSIKLD